jgi:hypothetical protein
VKFPRAKTVAAIVFLAFIAGRVTAQSGIDFLQKAYLLLGEQPIATLAHTADKQVFRLIEISALGHPRSIRVEWNGSSALVTVKRMQNTVEPFGPMIVRSRPATPADIAALQTAIAAAGFWSLPDKEDDRPLPQAPPLSVDGRVYKPNHPLTMVCSDAATDVLDILDHGRHRTLHRVCPRTDIEPIARAFYAIENSLDTAR